ncbi:P-loop containing nucleoside triphosphate hydrolase protein [Artomyces pyxidatus]|uniref:P-loop containing nucleoside triphosphate hydrolase protein n=1 Tax=Artomyces pyxidatus TaxID=48021 RepID=A0ACB8T117_9AGAM|nr:P-loop containing nucleoside triphosphate hydrolase protein [Artomyces pyxidatus]
MQRTALLAFSRCRHALSLPRSIFCSAQIASIRKDFTHSAATLAVQSRPALTNDDLLPTLQAKVTHWAREGYVKKRLEKFGIPRDELSGLLYLYAKDMRNGIAFRPENHSPEVLTRMAHDISQTNRHSIDQVLTGQLYAWACDPRRKEAILKVVSPATLHRMGKLRAATDFTRIVDTYTEARAMKRKIIMHVGPTNSGKTHTALRTLAAARVGAYAGPLRLLAHEIYERLNAGQIVPLGMDETTPETSDDAASSASDDATLFDAEDPTKPAALRKQGNPRFARPCSLLTGEERKVIEYATLISSTVEMLNMRMVYDVVVVDEIQMIADSERGQAWTSAVLGIAAQELHLCGEETAVPLIESLVAMTGDELIVNQYQRLTPLSVAKESLDNDLSKIQKGDCVVTFSRSGIFKLKEAVEKATGLRCAVAYGRLPPEIRSEQAALFNDPDSGYDVMIGSDAIGMGLNLKIRRVVFQSLIKFDGNVPRPLSLSHVKQIAGRAGRFGLHSDLKQGGVVTTLDPADLPYLESAMAAPTTPLLQARVGFMHGVSMKILDALPNDASSYTVREALIYTSTLPPNLAIMDPSRKEDQIAAFVDSHSGGLLTEDRITVMQVPFPYSDVECVAVVGSMLERYRDQCVVDLPEVLAESDLLDTLEGVLASREEHVEVEAPAESLRKLETLHKALVAYAWLHMHLSVSFPSYNQCTALMRSTERALDYCLQSMARQERSGSSFKHKGLLPPKTASAKGKFSRGNSTHMKGKFVPARRSRVNSAY